MSDILKLTVSSEVSELSTITDSADEYLEAMACPMKAQTQIDVVIDEIFSNISFYAYGGQVGEVTFEMAPLPGDVGVKLTFSDYGVPYNPLLKEDPDTTLSAEEREIGGLGIFIVKKMMDSVEYTRENDQNILVMTKNF